jgi:hypothetical protein
MIPRLMVRSSKAGSQAGEGVFEALVIGLGSVRAAEGEVGGEVGVDFGFVFAGQFALADADQTVDACP